jgi:hypothetical protein
VKASSKANDDKGSGPRESEQGLADPAGEVMAFELSPCAALELLVFDSTALLPADEPAESRPTVVEHSRAPRRRYYRRRRRSPMELRHIAHEIGKLPGPTYRSLLDVVGRLNSKPPRRRRRKITGLRGPVGLKDCHNSENSGRIDADRSG